MEAFFSYFLFLSVSLSLPSCVSAGSLGKGDGNAITVHIHEQTGSKLAKRDDVSWCRQADVTFRNVGDRDDDDDDNDNYNTATDRSTFFHALFMTDE